MNNSRQSLNRRRCPVRPTGICLESIVDELPPGAVERAMRPSAQTGGLCRKFPTRGIGLKLNVAEKTISIVDDNRVNMKLIRILLAGEGYVFIAKPIDTRALPVLIERYLEY